MAQVIHISGEENYANDGERAVVDRFAHDLHDEILVFPNVELVGYHRPGVPSHKVDEFDAIVVTPDAVICVEVKRLVGNVSVAEHHMTVDGDQRPNPFKQTTAKAKRLKGRLVQKDSSLRDVWVDALVVLAVQPANLMIVPEMKGKVVGLEKAVEMISPPWPRVQGSGRLSGRAEVIRAALDLQPRRPRTTYGSYRAGTVLSRGDNEDVFEARHDVTGARVELRVMKAPAGESASERKQRKRLLARAWKIAERVDDTACLVPPGEIFELDEGSLVIALPMAEDMQLVDRCVEDFGEEDRLHVLGDVAMAIATLHRASVVHGRLSPDAVRVQPSGRALLGQLDGALMPESRGETVVDSELDPFFAAPESFDRKRLSPATDLFALGRLISWLWPDEDLEAGPQAIGPDPGEIGPLVDSLTRRDQSERSPSAAEVALLVATRPWAKEETVPEPAEEKPAPGVVIHSFELLEQLEGAGPDVWLAEDLTSESDCVVKFFKGTEGRESASNQFGLLRSILDPGIQPVRHVGLTSDGAFLVSDLLEGKDLGTLLAGGRVFSVEEALELIKGLLGSLSELHEGGTVHGDVKPSNLVLTEGRLVLVDFDLAVPPHNARVAGTPGFLPPDVDHTRQIPDRDLYGAAVTLVAMLGGSSAEPPEVAELPVSVPGPVVEVVTRSLAATENERFASAGAFSEALQYAQRAARGFGVGDLVVEPLPAFVGSEPVARMDSQPPIEDPRIHPFRVVAPSGEAVMVHVVEDPNGGGQVLTDSTQQCGSELQRLERGLRLGFKPTGSDSGEQQLMLGMAKPGPKGYSTIQKADLEEFEDACGIAVRPVLSQHGVSRLGRLCDLFGTAGPKRNFLGAVFAADEPEAPLVSYVVSRILPIYRSVHQP